MRMGIYEYVSAPLQNLIVFDTDRTSSQIKIILGHLESRPAQPAWKINVGPIALSDVGEAAVRQPTYANNRVSEVRRQCPSLPPSPLPARKRVGYRLTNEWTERAFEKSHTQAVL